MIARGFMIAGLLSATASPVCEGSSACRCPERPLADYWAEAEEVVVGRFVGYEANPSEATPETRSLRFEVMTGAHKSARSGPPRRGELVTYGSALSSATCGVQGVEGGVYVLFAKRASATETEAADGELRIDTCTGSRLLLAPGQEEPNGFADVPARFVMQQLNGFAGLEVLSEVAERAPRDDAIASTSDAARALVGLLDVAGFSHAGFARLHVDPLGGSELVAELESYEQLETRESGYEESAAVVLARSNGWYRLRTMDGREGWLPPDQAGTYMPYPDVALDRLNYIEAPWHGFVWPSPGAGLPVRAPEDPARREIAVEVLERVDVGDLPWLRIRVLSESPCEVAEPRASVSGWIPAWAPDGTPQVWYYSRGC